MKTQFYGATLKAWKRTSKAKTAEGWKILHDYTGHNLRTNKTASVEVSNKIHRIANEYIEANGWMVKCLFSTKEYNILHCKTDNKIVCTGDLIQYDCFTVILSGSVSNFHTVETYKNGMCVETEDIHLMTNSYKQGDGYMTKKGETAIYTVSPGTRAMCVCWN